MTLQSFEPGQIVYEEQTTTSRMFLFTSSFALPRTAFGFGQSARLKQSRRQRSRLWPDTQRQAPDRSIFRMKIQKDSDGSQCNIDASAFFGSSMAWPSTFSSLGLTVGILSTVLTIGMPSGYI